MNLHSFVTPSHYLMSLFFCFHFLNLFLKLWKFLYLGPFQILTLLINLHSSYICRGPKYKFNNNKRPLFANHLFSIERFYVKCCCQTLILQYLQWNLDHTNLNRTFTYLYLANMNISLDLLQKGFLNISFVHLLNILLGYHLFYSKCLRLYVYHF